MEQLNLTSTKDNERVYKLLGDLMNMDKEFQIMITVPSAGKSSAIIAGQDAVVKNAKVVRDLEKDVTDMIHEIGVPQNTAAFPFSNIIPPDGIYARLFCKDSVFLPVSFSSPGSV